MVQNSHSAAALDYKANAQVFRVLVLGSLQGIALGLLICVCLTAGCVAGFCRIEAICALFVFPMTL